MPFSDETLIKQCLDGDTDAFGFLVDKYKGAVHALAYHKIGNYHDAEDIAQETFLKAYQNLSTLRNLSGFAGWLYVICANCCYSWLRRHRKQKGTVLSLRQSSYAEISSSSYTKHTDEEMEESVREAIDALPESEGTVVTLHYLGGLSCEEVSRFLGASLSAVKMRLFRARNHLREEMTEMLEQTQSKSRVGSGFTFRLMEIVQKMSPLDAPKPDIGRWISTSALTAALILGLGSLFISSTPPPFSFGVTQENMKVTLLDIPRRERDPETNYAIIMASDARTESGDNYPNADGQTGKDISALAQSDSAVNKAESADTFSMKGVIFEGDDRTRAGVLVYALMDGNPKAKTISDPYGTYQFDNLPVPSDGWYPHYTLFAYVDNEVIGWEKLGQPTAPNNPFALIRVSPTRRITGRVDDQAGLPVEGASVRAVAMSRVGILLHGSSPPFLPVSSLLPSASTDADGHFALRNIPEPGITRIHVEKEGYGLYSAYRQHSDYMESGSGFEKMGITLMSAGIIEGHVTDTANGEPVAGVLLQCKGLAADYSGLAANHRIDMTFIVQARSGSDGIYRFDKMPGGSEYTVSLAERLPEHTTAIIRGISIKPGETIQNVDVGLVKGGVISGRIATKDGEPVPGIDMDFRDDSGMHRIKTDEEGQYHFRAMAGEVMIPYQWENCIPAKEHPGPQIIVEEGEDIGSVDYVYIGVKIRGTVITADGKPAAGVSIYEKKSQGKRHMAESKADGSFILRIDFPEGSELTLMAEKNSEAPYRSTTITVAPNIPVEIRQHSLKFSVEEAAE